jgi:predicted dehydrogenase
MIRLGLIGCGTWGWRYLPASIEAGNCRITHVSRFTSAPREADGYLGGMKMTPDWRTLLDRPIDAFIVATPPDTHAEICGELLDRGRPVMVEKPVALDLGSAMWIAHAASRTATPLLVNHIHLFSPAYEEFRQRTFDWSSVEVVSMGGGPGPVRSYSALWDYGCHDVAMFLGLLRDGERVGSVSANQEGGRFRIALGAGSRRAITSVWNDGEKKRAFVAINEHSNVLAYDDARPGSSLLLDDSPISVANERPLTRALRTFAAAIESGHFDWRFEPTLGVEVTRILELADAAAKERRHGDNG